MRALLDTHTFLWYVLDDPALSAEARRVITDTANQILISPASYWEIAIKVSIGKYSLAIPFEEFWNRGIQDNGFGILPIEIPHAASVATLPFYHKDPFDRLMIAQAITENIGLISADATFDRYAVRRVW